MAVLTAVLASWWMLIDGPVWLPAGIAAALPVAARSLAAGSFLVAAVARLAWWRLTGDEWGARRALELIVLGVTLPVAVVVDWGLHDAPVAALDPPARLIVLVPTFGVVVVAAVVRQQPNARQIGRTLAALVFGTLAVVGLVVLFTRPATRVDGLAPAWLYLEAAAAAGWTVLAVHTWRRRGPRPDTLSWVVLAMLMMAVCEGIKASCVLNPGALGGVASGFQLAAGVLALAAATSDVFEALGVESRQTRAISRALRDTQDDLARVEQRERERLHDARSAVIGVMGASELLAEPTPPTVDRTSLQQLLVAELERLRAVLDSDAVEPVIDFALSDALGPVVLAHQLDGEPVRAYLGDTQATGRPRALATVLDNLLTNARVHAPGAGVEIRAVALGNTVVLMVDDDGPGIPAAEQRLVLRAGARGSNAGGPGTGLGLHSAAAAMAAQGGHLRILSRAAGGTRVLVTIPAADPVDAHQTDDAMAS